MIIPTITKEEAKEILVKEYGEDMHGILAYDDLYFTQFRKTYSSTSGPFGGIGGQAMTDFILQAWINNMGFAVVFYEKKILEVTNKGYNLFYIEGKRY